MKGIWIFGIMLMFFIAIGAGIAIIYSDDEPEETELIPEIDNNCYDMVATFGNGWSSFNVIYDYYEFDGVRYLFYRDSTFYMELTLREGYNMRVIKNDYN